MKKKGTLNAELSRVIASMGHTDKMVICDSGLPIPHNHKVVDLALAPNIPRFLDAVRVIMEELEVDSAIIAKEMEHANSPVYRTLKKLLPGVKIRKVSHEEFKTLTDSKGNVTFVRTGEATPYANVILISGVTFA
jgi:D-ribose pyranase